MLNSVSRAISVSIFAIIANANINTPVLVYLFDTLSSTILLSMLGTRVFFNLKEAAEHGVNVGTNWSSYSHSAIRFNETLNAGIQ